jgi:hypothetical protein
MKLQVAAGVSVNPDMITVPARHTVRPLVSYANGNINPLNKSRVQWNLEGKKFLQRSATRLSRRILLLVPVKERGDLLNEFTNDKFGRECVNQLIKSFLDYGHASNDPRLDVQKDFTIDSQEFVVQEGKNYEADFKRLMAASKAKTPPAELAVMLSPVKGGLTDAFADFKRIAEVHYGMYSICIAAKAAHDARYPPAGGGAARNLLPQYMGNVAMKLNLKLGNVNHSFELDPSLEQKMFTTVGKTVVASVRGQKQEQRHEQRAVDTMILGGDVTHPAKGSTDPSIAAVVGSVDDRFAKYPGSVRYQKGSTEVRTSHVTLALY